MFLFQEFGDHPNVIKLLNVMKADNDRDIYLVFEFMGTCSDTYWNQNFCTYWYIVIIEVRRLFYHYK